MIGVFGGTFDPVHHGHLRIALEIAQSLALDEVRFVPCRQPPHRSPPQASAKQRLAMLQLALSSQPEFVIDERELNREGPSYMVDTLSSMRSEEAEVPLVLIVGVDAFVALTSWYRWQHLLELAHIAVALRPGAPFILDGELAALYQRCQLKDLASLPQRPAGNIVLCPVTQLDISASAIRQLVVNGRSARYLLPDDVWVYLQQHPIYSK